MSKEDGIEKEVNDQINRGQIERYLEQVAGNVAAYHDALAEKIKDKELVDDLTRMYASMQWERFFGLADK